MFSSLSYVSVGSNDVVVNLAQQGATPQYLPPYTDENMFYYVIATNCVHILNYLGESGQADGVRIPPTIEGYPVVSLGQNCFFYYEYDANIYAIVIPASVVYVGEGAFKYNESLTGTFYYGDCPEFGADPYSGSGAIIYRRESANGWPPLEENVWGQQQQPWTPQ